MQGIVMLFFFHYRHFPFLTILFLAVVAVVYVVVVFTCTFRMEPVSLRRTVPSCR